MESDVTVFLEFYGLPGSGKSAISHLVADELRKQGKTVVEPTFDIDHANSVWKRKIIKLLKLVIYGIISPNKFRKLKKIIKENGYRGKDIFVHLANIAPKLCAYNNSNTEYVIFDEGLTQSAISLVRERLIAPENEIRLQDLCKERVILKFYVKVKTKTALERMSLRGSHDSRIEKITNAIQKEKALKHIEAQCEEIHRSFVVNNEIINEAVEMVINHIQEFSNSKRK